MDNSLNLVFGFLIGIPKLGGIDDYVWIMSGVYLLYSRDFVEQRGGSFEIDGGQRIPWEEEDDEELRTANMLPRKQTHEKYSVAELNEEFYKEFMAQDFSRLKIKGNDDCNEDSFEDMARSMDNITEDGGVKKMVWDY